MAAPGFGFSAGDFIGAIQLIVQVSKALKDAGGSPDEYCEVTTELSLLQAVLTKLHTSCPSTSSDDAFMEYAKQQATLTLSTLSDFLERISKFEAQLGPQRPASWYRGVGKKTRWTLFYAKEVDKLRLKIGTHLHALSIIFQLRECSRPTIESLDAKFNELRLQSDEVLQVSLRLNAHMDRFAPATRLPENHESTPTTPKNDEMILPSGSDQDDTIWKTRRSLQPGIQAEFNSLAMGIRQTSHSGSSSSAYKTSTLQFPSRQGDLVQQNDDSLMELLLRLIRTIIRDLRNLIRGAWFLFPHLMVLYRSLSTNIFMPPMLVVAESINFEDVLGRKVTLQHSYYKHWPNFNAFLRQQFRDCAGEKHIIQGQYYIFNSQTSHHLDTDMELVWPGLAFPGSQISMSVKLTAQQYGSGDPGNLCLKPGCGGKSARAEGQRALSCPKCGLTFFLMPSTNNPQSPSRNNNAGAPKAPKIQFATPCQEWPREAGSTQNIVGLDNQIEAFKKVHLSISSVHTPRRRRPRGLWVWICCCCGQGGIRKSISVCPSCGLRRCDNCETLRLRAAKAR